MKLVPLAFAAACLAGALTIAIIAPAHASTPLSQAISAPMDAGPVAIKTADPATTPG